MPLYEYECSYCGAIKEIIQKFSDKPYVNGECDNCGELALNKKISLGSFHLKGSGWYKDGYSNSKENS